MSQRVVVVVQGKEMQYEDTASLPLSLSIQTDSYLDLVGSEGTTVDNALEQIVFPGTKSNRLALGNPQHLTASPETVRSALPIQVSINGSVAYNGKCLVRSMLYNQDEVRSITVELFGGALEFFQILDGVKLPELDLGFVAYSAQSIQDSWGGSYAAGSKVVYAPVIYQALDQSIATNTYLWSHFRPSIYFRSIIDAIAAYANVTISSQLFETDFFQKHVYLFGVGDAWKTGRDINGYFSVLGGQSQGSSNWFPMAFTTESPAPYEDTQNVWATNTFTAPQDNVYRFSGELATGSNIEARFVVSNGATFQMSPGQPFSFTGIQMNEGETARIELRRTAAGTSFINAGSTLSGQGENKPVIGGSIDIASCLHDKEIKDFLRGITHQFNLAWTYDAGSKTVYVDPRHDFEIDGILYPGFYHNPVNSATPEKPVSWTDKIDQQSNVLATLIAPYGDSLTLRNQQEESDAYEIGKEQGAASSVEYLSSKLPFYNSTQGSSTNANPFWEDLVLVKGTPMLEAMPLVSSNWDPDDGLPEEGNFRSNPKYAYYEGYVFSHQWQPETLPASFQRPTLYQRPMMGGINEPAVCAGYSDYQFGPWSKPGYVSIFYPTTYQILFGGIKIEASAALRTTDVEEFPLSFRRLRKIRVGREEIYVIVLGISGFQPLNDQLTTIELLKWSAPRANVIAQILHSQQDSAIQLQL